MPPRGLGPQDVISDVIILDVIVVDVIIGIDLPPAAPLARAGDGEHDQLDAPRRPRALEHAREVRPHGRHAHVHLHGDLLVRQARQDQLDDPRLLRRQSERAHDVVPLRPAQRLHGRLLGLNMEQESRRGRDFHVTLPIGPRPAAPLRCRRSADETGREMRHATTPG
jgi:hypothetical protein